MKGAIVIPALFCINFEEVGQMDDLGVPVEKIMELRDVYIYNIDSTQDFHKPKEYNDGEIVINTIVFTEATEYNTPLTQQEIYNLYMSDKHLKSKK